MFIPNRVGEQIEKLLVLVEPLLVDYETLVNHLGLRPFIDISEAKENLALLKEDWQDIKLGLNEPD